MERRTRWAFKVVLSPDEVHERMAMRARLLEAEVTTQREALDQAARGDGAVRLGPRIFLLEDEYHLRIRESELDWVRALLCDLDTAGRYRHLARPS